VRLVIDTNVVVSAILWRGTPGRLIALAIDGEIELFTSVAPLDELADVLSRKKLAKAVAKTGRSADELFQDYRRLARRVRARSLTQQVSRDADDDHDVHRDAGDVEKMDPPFGTLGASETLKLGANCFEPLGLSGAFRFYKREAGAGVARR